MRIHVAALLALACLATQAAAQVPWTAQWTVDWPNPERKEVNMHHTVDAYLLVSGLDRAALLASGETFRIRSENEKLLAITKDFNGTAVGADGTWTDKFPLEALFIGLTNVYVEKVSARGVPIERAAAVLPIVIVREVRTIDHVFTGSVATLVSLLYINFGAALSLSKVKGIVRRPIGPAIGFVGQFIIMPLVSMGLLWYHNSLVNDSI